MLLGVRSVRNRFTENFPSKYVYELRSYPPVFVRPEDHEKASEDINDLRSFGTGSTIEGGLFQLTS
jgi:hypothetical protein